MIVNCNLFLKEINNQGISAVRLLSSYSFMAIYAGELIRHIPWMSNYNINPELLPSNDNMLIVFDGGITDEKILKQIAKHNEDKRLIFYYWNPVKTSINPSRIPSIYERWSYSPGDCQRYGMSYNSTFYFKDFYKEEYRGNIYTDICFAGKDKGRKKVLEDFKKQFEDAGLTTNFNIIATHPRFQKIGYQKGMSYSEVIDITLESLCILDYYLDPTAGLSLRAMESIFLRRKLITNNNTIQNYDFYHPNNIFILGNEQRSILDFIEAPIAEIDEEISDSYLFDNWILRFGG